MPLLIQRFSLSLVELEVKVNKSLDLPPDLKLPKLKKLKIIDDFGTVQKILGILSHGLEELHIRRLNPVTKTKPLLAFHASTLKSLKVISLDEESFNFIMSELPALETLEVLGFDYSFRKASGVVKSQSITKFVLKYSVRGGIPPGMIRSMENLEVIDCFFKVNIEAVLGEGQKLKRIKTKSKVEPTQLLEVHRELIDNHPSIEVIECYD